MEIDWITSVAGQNGGPTRQEIEEAFEDPHGVRLFPDSARFAEESRAFCLGKTLNGKGLFTVFRSDGKKIRVIGARLMVEEEEYFYQRKVAEWIS
jgi:uncharacterized DUF497 family protein